MSTVTTELSELPTVTKTRWRIDPARSSIEFRTPTLWGLARVKGRFDRYEGTLDLDQDPAIELTIDAGSLDTKNKLRDKHLRSEDFFDVEHSPEVRFVSDGATIDGQRLKVRGHLYAGGSSMPLELEAGRASRRRRARGRLEHARRPPRARDDAQHAWHDPHAQRADRPRPARERRLRAGAWSSSRTAACRGDRTPASALYVNAPKPVMSRPTISACMVSVPS